MRAISYILLTLISITSFGQTDVKVKRLYSDSVKVGNQWVSPYQWEKLKTSVIVDSNKFSTHYYTNRQIAAATTGLVDYRGTYNASAGTFPSTGGSGTAGAILKGDYWSISVEGTIGGVLYTVGSSLLAMVDNPGQTASNWDKQITGTTAVERAAYDAGKGYIGYNGNLATIGKFNGVSPNNLNFTGIFRATGGLEGYGGTTTNGVYGISISYEGVKGYSTNNYGGVFSSKNTTGIYITGNGGADINSTGNHILRLFYNNTEKASFNYDGKLTANGADFGTYTGAESHISAINGSTGTLYFGDNSNGGIGLFINNNGTGINVSNNANTGININSYSGTAFRIKESGTNSTVIKVDSGNFTKLIIDNQGDIHNTPPHASSWFSDSSRLITLTQNTWTGITNTWKKLYPSTGANYYFNKITKTGDSCKITKAGRYEIIYELNATGTANATYEYRLCKRSGSTITYYNKQVLAGTGATVVRIVSGSLPLIANDVVWSEVRTTTTGNNSITVIGGQIRVKTIKLDL